jgi:hypothetical protein
MNSKQFLFLIVMAFFSACFTNKDFADIQPKAGIIEIPAKGEIRIWKDINHASFEVQLTNNDTSATCEVYCVNSKGKEKWINPSLQAKKQLVINIPKNGYLLIKNFNTKNIGVSYKIEE